MRAKIKKAETTLDQAQAACEKVNEQQAAYECQERKPVGRPIDFPARLADAEVDCQIAAWEVNEAEARREKVRDGNKALSDCYHPFDLTTGRKRTPSRPGKELNQAFNTIETVLEEADLSDNSMRRIEKARRMIAALVSTLAFFWAMVRSHVQSLSLDRSLKTVFIDVLLPAVYLELHADKAGKAETKHQRQAMAERLYRQLDNDRCWDALPEGRKEELKKAALACAHYFQRSSFNVEGRNGLL